MLHLSFADIKKSAAQVAEQVRASGYVPDYVIGITVGGLIPLALIAKELETQKVATILASAYDEGTRKGLTVHVLPHVDLSNQSVLLVDDISDTGEILKELSALLLRKYSVQEVKTATIVIRKDKDMYQPDFYVIESDEWVVFPWEKGVEAGLDVP